MPRTRPAPRASSRKRPSPQRTTAEQFGTNRTLKIGIVALATLFTCSLLAGTLVVIPFDELFGLNDDDPSQNIVDPNDDLIEEQMVVVEENPEDVGAVLLLANILGNSGRLNEAIPYYEQAIELAPDDPSVRLDFARALADGGLGPDAELQFQRVLETKPDSQEAVYYLAELYMGWDPPREDEARTLYEESIELDPDSFIAEQAATRLSSMPATPAGGAAGEASPVSTPVGDGTGG